MKTKQWILLFTCLIGVKFSQAAFIQLSHTSIYPGQTIHFSVKGTGTHFTHPSTQVGLVHGVYMTTANYNVVSDELITFDLTCAANATSLIPVMYSISDSIDGIFNNLTLSIKDLKYRIIKVTPASLKRGQTADLFFYCEYMHFTTAQVNQLQFGLWNRELSPVHINTTEAINDTCLRVNVTVNENATPGNITMYLMNELDGILSNKSIMILAENLGTITSVNPAIVQQSVLSNILVSASNVDFLSGTNTAVFARNGSQVQDIQLNGVSANTMGSLNLNISVSATAPSALYDLKVSNSVWGDLKCGKCIVVNGPAFSGLVSSVAPSELTASLNNTTITVSGSGLVYPSGSTITFYDMKGNNANIGVSNATLINSTSLTFTIDFTGVKSGYYNMAIQTQTGIYYLTRAIHVNFPALASLVSVDPPSVRVEKLKKVRVVGKGTRFTSPSANVWIQYNLTPYIPALPENIEVKSMHALSDDTLEVTFIAHVYSTQKQFVLYYSDDSCGTLNYQNSNFIYMAPASFYRLTPNKLLRNDKKNLHLQVQNAGFNGYTMLEFRKNGNTSNKLLVSNYSATNSEISFDVDIASDADTGLYAIRCNDYFGDYMEFNDVFTVNAGSSPSGLNEASAIGPVHVYPNPATNRLNLTFPEIVEGEGDVNLVDLFGRQVYAKKEQLNSKQATIQLPDGIQKGIYLLRISITGGSYQQKVVLE